MCKTQDVSPVIKIVDGTERIDEIKPLILQYYKALNRDLSFQNIDEEMKNPAVKYTAPNGRILAAVTPDNKVIGCVAYHKLTDTRCEMKRLYVLPEEREYHAGGHLIEEIIRLASLDGYQDMVLDTIQPLQAAIHLYHKHGFKDCAPYYHNPMSDVIYMCKDLTEKA